MVEKTINTKNKIKNKSISEKNIKSKKSIKKQNKKPSKKMSGGDNIFQASINLITSTVDLGLQLFNTVDGVMNMPTDLKKGMKAADLNAPAQAAPAPKQQMPNNDLKDVKNVPIR
jgi:hypothetical protein